MMGQYEAIHPEIVVHIIHDEDNELLCINLADLLALAAAGQLP